MPVSTQHPEYSSNATRWKLVRDCIKGQDAVKNGGELYLPKPNPTDTTAQNAERYKQYVQRAMYLNVTGRTKNGLIGAIFRRDPTYELPKKIDYMAEDCDGGGQSLAQLGKWTCGELFATGNGGLLADYPTSEQGLTEAEQQKRNLRPMIAGYPQESILNWDYTTIGGKQVLTLLVLKEAATEDIDEFTKKIVDRYRVLKLNEDGNYVQQLYNEKEQPEGEELLIRRGDGNPWKEIPFVLCGAEDNKPGVDDSPLYDLAAVNIAHYRNSADHEENLYVHAQGTLFIDPGEMNSQQFNEANPNGVLMGNRVGHVLGKGGKAELLQIEASTALGVALKDKEAQMIAIGARLITATSGNQTAEEARINASGESSVLANVVGNASEAIEKALEYCAIFAGADPGEVKFELNRDFFDSGYDPQVAMAQMQELDRGLIAKRDYREGLRRRGVIGQDRTDEVIDEEVEKEGMVL